MKIMVETSAHHLHVTRETLDILYGKGYQLTNKKDLSQPGQFACPEKVTVVGPRGQMAMSILGPERPDDQIEVSLTDARKLGIVAQRHIHFEAKTAEVYGLKDKDIVSVKVGTGTGRETIFGDVVVRVSPKYAPAMHIDTDESNAAGLTGTVDGEIL